jgi:hypothetical protein
VVILHEMRHQLIPDSRMDDAFPWRDPDDPVGRVFKPYAGEDGQVHPALREHADRITSEMSVGKKLVRQLVSSNDNTFLPRGTKTTALWPVLEDSVAREVRRLVRGEHARLPVVPSLMTAADLRPHEQMLRGRNGLRLSPEIMLTARSGDRRDLPSLSNGRILGVYLGAVLDNGTDLENWERTHIHFPSYAMDASTQSGRKVTMSAEGAANAIAFANTALLPDTPTAQFDHNRINATFLGFVVRLPDPHDPSRHRNQSIVALAALDNAFDPATNPEGLILADYGNGYLDLFNQGAGVSIKVEEEDPKLDDRPTSDE